MSDDTSSKAKPEKSWFERLSQSLSREPQDREDLVELLRDAKQRKIIDDDDLEMLEGVLKVSKNQVRDIMIPRSHMITINVTDSLDEIVPHIIESGHSRFPIIEENKDEIMGILFAKDILKAAFNQTEKENFKLKEYLRKPVFTPESKRIDVLLKEFQQHRHHMAIVVDEYGSVAGLVTIEDVLEEIVGEIVDEHDTKEHEFIQEQEDNLYAINALTPIEDFNEYFHASLSDEEFDTIGGLVMRGFGYMPKKDETITIKNFIFTVLQADKRRITLLQATIMNQ